MAQRVIWTDAALDDLSAIAEYIERDSLYHARRFVASAFVVGNSIRDQPRLGRLVPELADPAVRERFLYSYRVIYRIRDQVIYILAVIHGRRLLEDQIDRFS